MKLMGRLSSYGRMIKFSHSIFALPFAFCGAALAASRVGIRLEQICWIVVAMVGARSAAMGFNRLVDWKIDAANARTKDRELPQGRISCAAVVVFVILSSAVLVFAAFQLNSLCLVLTPLALGIVFFYSYTKRFTWGTHFFLGLSIAVAPIGAWIAVTGYLGIEILILGGVVVAWVAGFDVIYACQDAEFDRLYGVFSIPQKFGIRKAFLIARIFHITTFGLMLGTGLIFALGKLYFVGLCIVGALLFYEHWLVKNEGLSRLGMGFMNLNGIIGVVYFLFTIGDLLIAK